MTKKVWKGQIEVEYLDIRKEKKNRFYKIVFEWC